MIKVDLSQPRLRLSLWQRIQLRVNGSVFIGYEQRPGWRSALPFYLARCPKHGFYESYPQGYSRRLICSRCLEEEHVRRMG